jgi:hypothetical protein
MVHPLVRERLPELHRVCARHHVRRLELFGSAAVDRFEPDRSDLVMSRAVKNRYFLEGIEASRTLLYAA